MSKSKKILIIFLKILAFLLIWFGFAALLAYSLDSLSKPGGGMGALVMILVITPAGVGSHLLWIALRSMGDQLSLFANILGGFLISLFVLLLIGMYVKAWDLIMFAMVGGFSLTFLVTISLIEFAFRGVDKMIVDR